MLEELKSMYRQVKYKGYTNLSFNEFARECFEDKCEDLWIKNNLPG